VNLIKIGKYVNTHGIKGEIRIISNFSRKDLVFIPSMNIYIKDKEYEIVSHRVHKQYDMLKLKDIDNINDIECLKNSDVYIDKDAIDIEYLAEDYIDYKVIFNDKEYLIKRIDENIKYKIIVLSDDSMIPFVDEYIENIDNKNKCIYVKNVGGLVK
jgi:16S rRNA processing protein RimM